MRGLGGGASRLLNENKRSSDLGVDRSVSTGRSQFPKLCKDDGTHTVAKIDEGCGKVRWVWRLCGARGNGYKLELGQVLLKTGYRLKGPSERSTCWRVHNVAEL